MVAVSVVGANLRASVVLWGLLRLGVILVMGKSILTRTPSDVRL